MNTVHRHALFVDTSFFYPLADEQDHDHDTCKSLLVQAKACGFHIITTNFIIAETQALILSRLGRDNAFQWLEAVESLAWLERVTEADEERAVDIIRQYADKDFSYTDATCFAVMERFGITVALSVDQHFVQYSKFLVLPLMGTQLPTP